MDRIGETKPVLASRQGLTRRAAGYHLAVELSETAKLALPMMLTQVGQIAMMTTDLAFIDALVLRRSMRQRWPAGLFR